MQLLSNLGISLFGDTGIGLLGRRMAFDIWVSRQGRKFLGFEKLRLVEDIPCA